MSTVGWLQYVHLLEFCAGLRGNCIRLDTNVCTSHVYSWATAAIHKERDVRRPPLRWCRWGLEPEGVPPSISRRRLATPLLVPALPSLQLDSGDTSQLPPSLDHQLLGMGTF